MAPALKVTASATTTFLLIAHVSFISTHRAKVAIAITGATSILGNKGLGSPDWLVFGTGSGRTGHGEANIHPASCEGSHPPA